MSKKNNPCCIVFHKGEYEMQDEMLKKIAPAKNGDIFIPIHTIDCLKSVFDKNGHYKTIISWWVGEKEITVDFNFHEVLEYIEFIKVNNELKTLARNIVEKINLENVYDYLKRHRWKEFTGKKNDNCWILQKGKTDKTFKQLLLPKKKDLGDYGSAMIPVVREICLIEKRPVYLVKELYREKLPTKKKTDKFHIIGKSKHKTKIEPRFIY